MIVWPLTWAWGRAGKQTLLVLASETGGDMYVFLEPAEKDVGAFKNRADNIYFQYAGVWGVCTNCTQDVFIFNHGAARRTPHLCGCKVKSITAVSNPRPFWLAVPRARAPVRGRRPQSTCFSGGAGVPVLCSQSATRESSSRYRTSQSERNMGLLPGKDCGNDPGETWVSTQSLFFPPEFPLAPFTYFIASVQIFCSCLEQIS